jgi:DNA mismatch repair protein MutS2
LINPLSSLEFEKIINFLLKYIKTAPGENEIKALQKSDDAVQLNRTHKKINEMIEFLKFEGVLHFDELKDITGSLNNSQIEGFILPIDEIIEINKTLRTWKSIETAIKEHEENNEKYPLLYSLITQIKLPIDLLRKISHDMDQDGNILDNASEELKRIRKRKSSIRQDIQNRLRTIMERKNFQDVVQEKIVTIRDGRFVIPIRSQFKNKVKNEMNYIVHSYSKSTETTFVEPEDIIYLNNEMIEIDELEWVEIQNILKGLTEQIKLEASNILNIYHSVGTIESIFSRARFAMEFNCHSPEIVNDSPFIKLINAYHPLLGEKAVPINVELGKTCQGIVISGPNAGGKTVALKTVGLLTLMALSGIPIPADKYSQIGIFKDILVEIGDEQSISENLSSFSGHILNIAGILKNCTPDTLVLIDEIASSTEPKEGEALGREIIKYLVDTGSKFIITTHFQGIKEIAYSDNKVKNAFVEFDEEKLIPLYRIHIGGTGSSYALKAAKKYGLPNSILEKAESYLVIHETQSDKLLKEIEAERNIITKKRNIIDNQLNEIRVLKDKYNDLLKQIEKEKISIEKKGVNLLKKELDEALREVSELRDQMKHKKVDNIKTAGKKLNNAQEVLKVFETEKLEKEKKHVKEFTIGQNVFVGGLNKEGYIEDISGNKVKVRIGIISTQVNKDDLYISDKKKDFTKPSYSVSINSKTLPFEIDIRGNKYEEALKIIEKNVDHAIINGLNFISIIHGKGEGILRKAVWDYLKSQNSIKSYNYAKPEDGGQGKTIVYLK